ncbi:MAG: sodium/glutamate symporter [Rhodobacteraceae bacterium]|nr:sodium/glutamate symporter [Paracoccaceae bacterium]
MQDPIEIANFGAVTLGILVYFLGARLTKRFSFLSNYSIPEPVSGGLLAAVLALIVVLMTGRTISYELGARDFLLVYFFTTVGLNARLADLMRGGPLLVLMLGLTITFMILQNLTGMLGALLFDLPSQAGVLLGTASLIGGHGTAIAWGPTIESTYAVPGASELGIATATVGLIMASVLGGPIARILIKRNNLSPAVDGPKDVATAAVPDQSRPSTLTHVDLMNCVLVIHAAIAIGYVVFEALEAAGIKLPLFVPCLLTGIVMSNTLPPLFPKMNWPAGTPAMSVISEFSLSVFLSMSLMSMELWSLASSAGVLITTMVLQALIAVLFIFFVVFKLMGRNYFAAVISAGFAGFSLGATPTAIANMTAVTQKYGPSPVAFIVLPLVSAFFVDLANAFIIQWFLGFG